MGVVEIVADKVGKVLGEWFESIEARIAALEGKDAEDGCTYDHPFVDMDEVRAAIQQGTPKSTGSGLCPKCGCNTSRTYDKKQFECIGCGHVWTCEAAGDGMSPLRPHHIEDRGDEITPDILEWLRRCEEDVMWADHAEVPKSGLRRVIKEIERLRSTEITAAMKQIKDDMQEIAESLGVRPMYYNGAYSAYINQTNVPLKWFKSMNEAKTWCAEQNRKWGTEDAPETGNEMRKILARENPITPAMISAGLRGLSFFDETTDDAGHGKDVVIRIYRAMTAARESGE